MNEEELYEFDLRGFIIFRGFLSPERVRSLDLALGPVREAPVTGKFSFLARHPLFMELMAEPRTVAIMKALIGPWLRFDHSFGIQMTKETPVDNNLHGGHREDQGSFFYEVKNGVMRNGQVGAMYVLSDTRPGDGGFVCVPGSHKAGLQYRPALDSPLVINPELRAGDLFVFTEALVHGSRRWQADHTRRVLFYLYTPGYMAYRAFDTMAPFLPLATTPLQRELLRPPDVNSYHEELVRPGEEWPTGNYRPVMTPPDEGLPIEGRVRERLDAVVSAGHAGAYRVRRWLVRRGLL